MTIEIDAEHPLAKLVDRAIDEHEIITLKTKSQKKAVLLSLEAFEHLINMRSNQPSELMSDAEFHQQFHQVLVDSGYDSREKIINLIQEVKQEMAEEGRQRTSQGL